MSIDYIIHPYRTLPTSSANRLRPNAISSIVVEPCSRSYLGC
nr:MAG TPA: Ion transport protein N-terminal [Caudoviricetes sp.]